MKAFGVVRETVWAIDPDLSIANLATLEDLLVRRLAAPRFRTALLTSVEAMAIVLAIVGVYASWPTPSP